MKKEFRRPDEAALRRVIDREKGELAEIILRLAWEVGLTREEIRQLTWTEVSFSEMMIVLPDRSIPMVKETSKCLETRYYYRGRFSEYVVHGNRQRHQMEPQSISRIARIALDAEESLKDISLRDLRQDYILRMLSKHDWPYVARVSGIRVTTLISLFSGYLENSQAHKPSDVKPDEFFVWKIVQAEGNSPEGLAIWMAWKHSMEVNEIIELTWSDVDFDSGIIKLAERDITMDAMLKRRLQAVLVSRTPEDDPHVLLTNKARKPYDHARISKTTRTIFIRNGAENMTLRDLVLESKRSNKENAVLRMIEQKGSITREEVVSYFNFSATAAYHLLRRMVDEEKIVRIGQKYYLAEKVVPPEEQYPVIYDYLKTVRSAFRQEFVELLHIEPLQCGYLLGQLVKEGKLVRSGQRYRLPSVEE